MEAQALILLAAIIFLAFMAVVGIGCLLYHAVLDIDAALERSRRERERRARRAAQRARFLAAF